LPAFPNSNKIKHSGTAGDCFTPKTMVFANWKVTQDSIAWNGTGLQRFVIPIQGLTSTTKGDDDQLFYEWILLATEEDWLTQNDLYDLNYAFVYAIAKFGLEFNYEIFDSTLEEQFDRFDEEDDDDYED
jgi:hypothetical protein